MKKIESILSEFKSALDAYDRKRAVHIAVDAIQSKSIDVPTLYEQILAPSLNIISSNQINQEIPIWDEHLRSNIVRTVLENIYPMIEGSDAAFSKSALVVCLEEEYHELGARMTADYLTILGFKTYFIGANTPKKEVLLAIEHLSPDLICISVTNYFHLTRLHGLVETIKMLSSDKSIKIAIGGYAVHHSTGVEELVKADFYANSYDDLTKIKEALL